MSTIIQSASKEDDDLTFKSVNLFLLNLAYLLYNNDPTITNYSLNLIESTTD